MMSAAEQMPIRVVHRTQPGVESETRDVDPITTEIIRNGLLSVAEQVKRTVVRTSFSPIIYETLDFAVSVYDEHARLIAQAPTLHLFMGILSTAVENVIDAVGSESMEPGDVVLYNVPYGTGSHAQDAALVMPVFAEDGELLVGYIAIMEHWLDLGAKDFYCTDTVDVYQEGLKIPALKLYRGGVRNEDIHRILMANTRMPKILEPEISAQVGALRVGAVALERLVDRHGLGMFSTAVDTILNHGEASVRRYLSAIPDGVYVGHGELDDNAVDEDPLPFTIRIEVQGTDVTVDYTDAPDAQPTPINATAPAMICVARVALAMLAGSSEPPNDGHFRPVAVVTRPGSLFHALPPSPCFLGWGAIQCFDVIFEAMADALPSSVPAWSGGDLVVMTWWGNRQATRETWADGCALPIGLGASFDADGNSSMMHWSEAAVSFPPIEVWEANNPWIVEHMELAPDSGGPGKHRGGLGVDIQLRATEDCWLTTVVERTKTGAPGLDGGGAGRPNFVSLEHPDGTMRRLSKNTRVSLAKGSLLTIRSAGGGGYGAPELRSAEAILNDLANGYISEEFAQLHYPQLTKVPTTVARRS